MAKLIQGLRQHINRLAALVLVGLALNTTHGVSLVATYYADAGIPRWIQASVLLAGAALLIINHRENVFILGTLPLAMYTMTTIYITLDRRGGYPTAIVYAFAYLELLALYDCHGGPDGRLD